MHIKEHFVFDTINAIDDLARRKKLIDAFCFLMTCDDSHYKHFAEQYIHGELKERCRFYDLVRIQYIETALWPVLYFKDKICESHIVNEDGSKISLKRKYLWKCFLQYNDYSNNFILFSFNLKGGFINSSQEQLNLPKNSTNHQQIHWNMSHFATPTGVGSIGCYWTQSIVLAIHLFSLPSLRQNGTFPHRFGLNL